MEYLEEAGAATPKDISNNTDLNNKYVGVRCRTLTEAGLLQRPARGLYRLTGAASEFLDGDFDASELPDPAKD